jgi:hypothetical protein
LRQRRWRRWRLMSYGVMWVKNGLLAVVGY